MKPLDLPKYYDVDGTYVKVDYDSKSDEVFGETANGVPYPILKAESEGEEISQSEFNKRASTLR